MSKRSRGGDTLTGGSRDFNPQTLQLIPAYQAVADTMILQSTPLPIPRLAVVKGKSLVIEALAVDMFLVPIYVANTITYVTGALTTNGDLTDPAVGGQGAGTGIGAFNDPRTLAQHTKENIAVGLNLGAGQTAIAFVDTEMIKHIDLTDEAGHGILIATDSIYLACSSALTGVRNTVACKLTYRWKDVSLEEYIGIVQSQQ